MSCPVLPLIAGHQADFTVYGWPTAQCEKPWLHCPWHAPPRHGSRTQHATGCHWSWQVQGHVTDPAWGRHSRDRAQSADTLASGPVSCPGGGLGCRRNGMESGQPGGASGRSANHPNVFVLLRLFTGSPIFRALLSARTREQVPTHPAELSSSLAAGFMRTCVESGPSGHPVVWGIQNKEPGQITRQKGKFPKDLTFGPSRWQVESSTTDAQRLEGQDHAEVCTVGLVGYRQLHLHSLPSWRQASKLPGL